MPNNIVEVRRQLESIEAKYEEKMRPIKAELLALQQQLADETNELRGEYEHLVDVVIDSYTKGTYEKIAGVQVRELKDFEVFDSALIPNEFMKMEVSKSKIKEKLKETDYSEKIPGVNVYTKYSVAIKL